MKHYKENIECKLKEYYSDVENIDGRNLEELGEWVDILKDINQMIYYGEKACYYRKVTEAMERSGDIHSATMTFESMVREMMPDMSPEDKKNVKAKLQSLIDNLK